MIDPLTHIFKKDKTLEKAVLCEIIMCRYIHPDIKTEYFTDHEQELFIELRKQWNAKREIDIELLRYDFEITIQAALDSTGTCSVSAIEKLRELWFQRRRGEIMIECEKYETGQDALRSMQKLSGESLMVKNSQEYNHEETMNILITQLEKDALHKKEIRGIGIGIKNINEATIKSITYLGQNRPSIRKLKIELSNGRTIKAQKCHESWEHWGGSQDELRLTMPTVEANNEWLHGGAEPA